MQLVKWLEYCAIALALLNVVATAVALFATGASWRQSLAQTAVVWLLPVIGAFLVLHLHVDMFSRSGRRVNLSAKAPHLYVAQVLEAEARAADHAARASLEHSAIEALSHSDGSDADGH